MKLLFVQFVVSLLAASPALAESLDAYNGSYQVVEYTWCEGPHSGPSPGQCSVQTWHGVDLDSMSSFTIDFTTEKQVFRVHDLNGLAWEMDLLQCQTPAHKPFGCKSSVKGNSTDGYSISINEWDSTSNRRIRFGFNGNELTIRGLYEPLMMFRVTKK